MTDIAAAFVGACELELAALKPGNVHRHAAGHGMTEDDFRRSAAAAAPPLCRPGARLGERILGAVSATRDAVGQNTNLGIVLLCAPLAQGAEAGGELRAEAAAAIAASDLGDADQVFRAIALASPGGLGTAESHDVRAPAAVLLPQAMAEASGRDAIARQWTTRFADVFDRGVPGFEAALARWRAEAWAATETYLRFLAAIPDSHVSRKYGIGAAADVQAEAAGAFSRLDACSDPEALVPALLAWDAELKRRRINPGTSADLTVATIFAWRLRNVLRQPGFAG